MQKANQKLTSVVNSLTQHRGHRLGCWCRAVPALQGGAVIILKNIQSKI